MNVTQRYFFFGVLFLESVFFLAQKNCTENELSIPSDSLYLNGTFIDCPSPYLVVLIAGSGPTDRNGNSTFAKMNTLKFLAEDLAEKNISTYRYDKRIFSTRDIQKITDWDFDDFVRDAQAVINTLDSLYPDKKIIVAGHSEGSLIAILASQNNAKVTKLISLAGPANSIDKILMKQINDKNPFLALQLQTVLDQIKNGNFPQYIPTGLEFINPSNQKFLQNIMEYTPYKEIQTLTIPILLANGTSDLQIPINQASLLAQNSKKGTLLLIDKMNHPLKIVENSTENIQSYNNPDLPVSTLLLEKMADFITN